jgi:hypothetical protein
LLSRELGALCYASGSGGSIGYTMVGTMVFNKLSIKMPLTTLWPSKDLYRGIGQSEALQFLQLSNEIEVKAYLQRLKEQAASYKNQINPLLIERAAKIRSGKSIVGLLSDLFALKESQRNIRKLIKVAEKVSNAVSLSPSFIDYAINFGVVNTEIQWRQNLIKNDILSAPTIMMRA